MVGFKIKDGLLYIFEILEWISWHMIVDAVGCGFKVPKWSGNLRH
jgi:hypothetical protein